MINTGDLQGPDEKNCGDLISWIITEAKLELILNAYLSKLTKLQDGSHSL